MEKSLFWFTNGFAGDIGDGSAPYTQEEVRLHHHAMFAGNVANAGVFAGVLNILEVAGVATPLTVDTGRGSVYGFPYWNDASLNVAVATPGVGDTGGRVILRASWVTQTVRAIVVLNADGNAAIPALTQVANTTWDIPLATFVIDTAGNIWTDSSTSVAGVTDARVFCRTPLSSVNMDYHQGFSDTDWSAYGTTDFPVNSGSVYTIAGSIITDAFGSATVTFPVAFSAAPLVIASVFGGVDSVVVLACTVNDATIFSNLGSAIVHWLAIGPRVS